ncbi:hypothetical protein B0H10DRAFT_1820194, partial [Mycena sp. CBHHK59/15]
PSQGESRQSNEHDCGIWVLCMMGAIMRGYHTTGVSEGEMRRVREVLARYVLSLPYI